MSDEAPPSSVPAPELDRLAQDIEAIHHQLQAQAQLAVNLGLTLRNWLIGRHIEQVQLAGATRAAYGDQLIPRLAERLQARHLPGCQRRELYRYRDFFRCYPDIVGTASPLSVADTPLTALLEIVATPSPPSDWAQQLLRRLSYSHFALLSELPDPLQRRFYEVEALRSSWSVRELKRQIGSLYYQRSGLSTNPQALSQLTHQASQPQTPAQVIRDPYVFEFLGLQPAEVLREADLESALIERLQAFLLELGHGFCFEARQKRLLIGGEHFFIDLVFYHRILKCHVLVELKADHFRHEHLGQLNTYVAWYREHMMSPGDQPPIGILLCTAKNDELVHYALAGLAESLFVSRYQVDLPKREEMAAFLGQAMQELGNG